MATLRLLDPGHQPGEYTNNLTRWQETIQQETGLGDLKAEEDRTEFAVEMERRVCPEPVTGRSQDRVCGKPRWLISAGAGAA